MKYAHRVMLGVAALSSLLITRPPSIAAETAETASPVAHVYVATPKGVDLYNADVNGKLTLQHGSPFSGNFVDVVTNGKYFYGADATSIYLNKVGPHGELTPVEKFSAGAHAESLIRISALNLDHTGSTLYANVLVDGGMVYESYRVSKTDGSLEWLGNADQGAVSLFGTGPLRITGSDRLAVQTQNYFTWFVQGFTIGSNHELVSGLPGIIFPEGKEGILYNPYAIATDPTNHFALAAYPQLDPPTGPLAGPTQLATYTIDSAGNQTTTSTFENMPPVDVTWVSDMNMSYGGDLLAVAGNGPGVTGLEVFHFNGAKPITKYTSRLTNAPIDDVHWDKNNHLYAISKAWGKVYVFTVTPTSVKAAPGSPFSIGSPQSIIIRPLD